MSRSLAAVDFKDGLRLYLIYDGTVGVAWRPLFTTAEAAWDWYESGSLDFAEPFNAARSELPVVLTVDLNLEGEESVQFQTRASAEAMWLTGPCSTDEKLAEEPFFYGCSSLNETSIN